MEAAGCWNITQVSDVWRARGMQGERMEILIHLDRSEPPAGTLTLRQPAGGTLSPVEFVGWLGMLRAMYEVIGYMPPAD